MTGTHALATAALVLHALSAAVWVGGIFFAHQVLRPAAAALDPGPRLVLWSRVLGRFFAWVIAAIVLLLASGYVLVFAVFGGFGKVGLHVHLMQGIGILMMLLSFTSISPRGAVFAWRSAGKIGPRAAASSARSARS